MGLQFLLGELCVAEDLAQEPGSDVFTGMDRYDGPSTIRVVHEVMAALDAQDHEAELLEDGDQLLAGDGWKLSQTETRWTPTKLSCSSGTSSASRQREIASRMRSMSWSSDFAWVWQPGMAGTEAT